MSTSTLPQKIVKLNLAVAGQALSTTAHVVRTVARNAMNVVDASRTAGKVVVGQSRSVVVRTVTTARNGTREVAGQVQAQGEHLGEVIAAEANRTADAALRATSDSPSGKPYEQWTKAQLMERAQELDIDGRASMNKDALIEALRS